MKKDSFHITLRILALTLVFAVLTPTIVKFSHGFQDHKHQVCSGESTSHFHELDIDCEFYKFKLNNTYSFNFVDYALFTNTENAKLNATYYFYLKTHQQNTFRLRGPPIVS